MDLNIKQISNNPSGKNKHDKQKVNFGSLPALSGLANGALRTISDDKFIGATFSDVGFMVLPRTAIDTKEGGPQLGFETGFREVMGVIDHSVIGLIGVAAGYILSQGLKKEFGVNAGKITASTDTTEFLHGQWGEKGGLKFAKNVINNIHGLVNGEYVPLSQLGEKADIEALASRLHDINTTDAKLLHENTIPKLANDIRSTFKIPNCVKLNGKVETELDTVLKDSHHLYEIFEKVGKEKLPAFVEKLTKVSYGKTALGIAVAMTIGCSIQAVNRMWTKKRTGKDGFPGASGGADKSQSFFAMRLGAMAGMVGLVGYALGVHKDISALKSQRMNLGEKIKSFAGTFAKKVQFNGYLPTINQLKLIYGTTIMSRFYSAQQKDELRESTIKDYLGYANWLLLGSFVTKLTAHKWFENDNILNITKTDKPNKRHYEVKSYDEVFSQVKGLALYNEHNTRRPFGEIVKDLKAMGTPEAKEALKNIKHLNISNGAGILYSFLALGVALPYMNRIMTKHFDAKRQAKQATGVEPTNISKPSANHDNISKNITYASNTAMSSEQKKLFADFVKAK